MACGCGQEGECGRQCDDEVEEGLKMCSFYVFFGKKKREPGGGEFGGFLQ